MSDHFYSHPITHLQGHKGPKVRMSLLKTYTSIARPLGRQTQIYCLNQRGKMIVRGWLLLFNYLFQQTQDKSIGSAIIWTSYEAKTL